MNEAQELHCHSCNRYVQFSLDLSVDGDYRLDCPSCGHDHYRIVVNGKITERRWGRSPSQQQVQIWATGTTSASTWTVYVDNAGQTGTSTFAYQKWMNIA